MKLHKEYEALLSVALYSACSTCMTLLNKLLMFTYSMPYPNVLLFCQNGAAALLVILAKHCNFITYPDLSMKIVRQWLPLSVLFVAMLITSMKSLEIMSVPAQTVIKNLAIVLTAVGDSIFYEKRITCGMYMSFALMALGSYLSAKGDSWVTWRGILWTFANIICTVLYTLYMKKITTKLTHSIGRYSPVVYNNLLSLPFFIIGGLNDVSLMMARLTEAPWQAYVCLLFMLCISACMTFGVFWCMEVTSPTTFSVVGALNKIPIAVFGIFLFRQYPEPVGYAGILIALSSGILYTVLNLRAGKHERHKRETVQLSSVHHK